MYLNKIFRNLGTEKPHYIFEINTLNVFTCIHGNCEKTIKSIVSIILLIKN